LDEELESLRQQLSDAQEALEDARREANAAASAVQVASTESKDVAQPNAEQTAAIKSELDERAANLEAAEANLGLRDAAVTERESKAESLKTKLNLRLKEGLAVFKAQIEELKAEHESELARVRQTARSSTNLEPTEAAPASTAVPEPESSLKKTVDLPDEGAAEKEIKDWINGNATAKRIIHNNVERKTNNFKELLATTEAKLEALKTESEKLQAQPGVDTSVKAEGDQQQAPIPENLTDQELELWKKQPQINKWHTTQVEELNMKAKLQQGMTAQLRAKWTAIEQIAKDSPTEEVAKAVEVARQKRAPVPAPQSTALQASTTSAPTSAPHGGQQQPPLATTDVPQANGTSAHTQSQVQSSNSNPFRGGPPAELSNAENPWIQAQLGRGNSGIAPPNFLSQPPQQQHQQGGRGRGADTGTGPRALQGIIASGATNIPRGGGSNIPLPGGRGRGQQPPQQQNQQNQQPLQINTQNQSASQIGRGNHRGGGRNHGGGRGQNSNQNSPRNSLNPGAQQFNPGNAGRGQKRGPEDDGEGANRGGKRPRGRGGQGGGE
jgi:nucleoprotein TPR